MWDEPALELGGAAISLRGIASIGALATTSAPARSPEHRDPWARHVEQIARAGMTAFESTANSSIDRRFVKRLGEGSVLPPRLLSGALNFYLAAQVAGTGMVLPEREGVLRRAAAKVDECLSAAAEPRSLRERTADIGFMRRFIRGELLPPPGDPPAVASQGD